MSVARHREIFDAALDIVDDAERRTMVDQTCAGDEQLRANVEELLAAHFKSEKFFFNFASVVAESATQALTVDGFKGSGQSVQTDEDLISSKIGPYKLLQKIGEGGCGVVYMAEQELPVRRRVALKIIKLGMDTRSVIARFAVEQQALALMDHPNIARVLDAGATQTGRPFFVMELVQGVRITDYCDTQELETRQRLKLFIQICHAIQHAHQKGIIHRDIKPTNILVSEHDGVAMPKVIDFGIAKAMEEKLTEDSALTACGLLVGTPAYMSPEQVQMSRLDVDTRSDIYSLGVLLYELLAGKTPFDQRELVASGLDEMRRIIIDQEPQRPSVKLDLLPSAELMATAHRRHVEPPKLRSELAGDLDWIVMKALEKDRSRRYQTANGLALDVQRFLDNEPIFARPPSRFYRFQKLIRRNKIIFAASGIVIATLVVGIFVSTRLWLREREALQQVVAEQRQKAALQQEAIRLESLRQTAEEERKFAQATAFFRQGKLERADDLLDLIPNCQVSVDDAPMFRQTGDWDAQQGRWAKALSRFSVLIQINEVANQATNANGFLDDFRFAAVLVDQGELAKYDSFRRTLIHRYVENPDPLMAGRVLRLGLLSQADDAMLVLLKPFKDRTIKLIPSDKTKAGGPAAVWNAYSLALADYRARDYVSATNWCAIALSSDQGVIPFRDVCIQLIDAMAMARLGDLGNARTRVAALRAKVAVEANDLGLHTKQWHGYWFDWAIVRILLREADHLLGNDSETSE